MAEARRPAFEAPTGSGAAYEEAKRLARAPDAADRRRLAERADTPGEILYFLAEDPDPQVRLAIARNPATPRQADELLLRDPDEAVRSDLARKIAELTPELAEEQRAVVRRMTIEALETLARDQAGRVRAILADAVKDVTRAPPEVVDRVVGQLARDPDLAVAGPILEHSRLISDDVLIEIVRSPSVAGAVARVSRRRDLSGAVADAIVATDDRQAITQLLANQSAQIREETLDRLIERAESVTEWHEPLVQRPRLSARGATRLARFVAAALIAELQRRQDLDVDTAGRIADIVDQRIAAGDIAASDLEVGRDGQPLGDRSRAIHLHGMGQLDAQAVLDAVVAGKRAFVMAALSLLAELDEPAVHQLINSRSPKAIVALCWKAKVGMGVALELQSRLAGLPPRSTLKPDASGGYPLDEATMEWQIDLVRVPTQGGAVRRP